MISTHTIAVASFCVSCALAAACSLDASSRESTGSTSNPIVHALYNAAPKRVVAASFHAGSTSPGGGAQGQCGPTVDPRVSETLTAMAHKLTSAQTLVFTALTTTEDVSSTLQKLQFDTTVKGVVKRPNLAFVEKAGAENVTIWFDGSTLIVLDRSANTFLRVPVKGDIDALLAKLDELQIEAPFGGLLSADLEQKVSEYVYQGDYYAQTLIDDRQVHHLALRQENVDWQVWIDVDTALPKKAVITSKMLAAAPEHQLLIKDLQVDGEIDASVFKAALPADAREVPVTP
jgi:hypothetical protein